MRTPQNHKFYPGQNLCSGGNYPGKNSVCHIADYTSHRLDSFEPIQASQVYQNAGTIFLARCAFHLAFSKKRWLTTLTQAQWISR